jgi:hypothetical protein
MEKIFSEEEDVMPNGYNGKILHVDLKKAS